MPKKIIPVIVVCWLFAAQVAAAASPSALSVASQSDWRQWRGGADHRGVNRYETTLSLSNVANLELQWVGNNGFNSSPAVAKGVLYVSNGGLHAYPADCASDGSVCPPLWTGGSDYADWSSPAVGGGAVYIGGVGGLFAFKVGCRSDGGQCPPLWRGTTATSAYTSPTFLEGVVYIANDNGNLEAYDTSACAAAGGFCSPMWRADLGGNVFSSPAIADGIVYVGGHDGFLYAFKTNCGTGGATCSPLWKGDMHDFSYGTPAVAGGTVYIATGNGGVYAFPTACRHGNGTCQPLWHAALPASIHSSPAVTDTTVFVGARHRLYALSVGCATDGSLCSPLWKSREIGLDNDEVASSPAVANGIVFVGSQVQNQSSGRLFAFPAECGKGGVTCRAIWKSAFLPGMVNASPAVAHGMVYVASNGGRTFAFGLPD
jgi:outer membrane protein assembly factor BamB